MDVKTALVGVLSKLNYPTFFMYKNKQYQIGPGEKTKKEFSKNFLTLKKGLITY